MQTGFRFRCYPDKAQAQTLLHWIGCQRFIYNAKVGEDRYFRIFARKSLQHAGQNTPQDQQYAHFITEDTAWLREAPSVVLRNGSVRWKHAYGRYYKKPAGRPVILCGEYREKASKKTMRMAKKQSNAVGADRSNRDERRKPVETSVRHPAGNGQRRGSQKQESMTVRPADTPATSLGL